ncbi:2-dehydropantoate 2-reductase [Photobacterium minamisatsumaniensis]|uniref:2-dehydropantoate 2-reductase n=1 Tax=Photobacterium minamisatsumaniensis TaxID=2910233 RepID=UPI003D0E3D3C
MRITIVGAGAVGRLWGSQLSQHHQVHFWTRQPDTTLAFNFVALSGNSQQLQFPANNPAQLTESDCVLVTVKAFQVEQALLAIRSQVRTSTPIIIMHNGMGTHQAVLQLLPHNPVLYATTSQAAYRPDQNTLVHTGIGATWLGSLNDTGKACIECADIFHHALAPSQWHQDIFQPLWTKLAINCAINPLTAIYKCRNGDLADSKFQSRLTAICHEVASVMSAEGYPSCGQQLKQQVEQVILATASNFSSMNQDVSQQRASEIDYITGYLISRADAHGIAVPENHQLWKKVKQLEQHYHD